jgi:hypothetical protein
LVCHRTLHIFFRYNLAVRFCYAFLISQALPWDWWRDAQS